MTVFSDVGAQSAARKVHASAASISNDTDDTSILQEFRTAFSHIERQGDSLTAWLTEPQQAAMRSYHAHFRLTPKAPWNLSELHQASPAELAQVEAFRTWLQAHGKLDTPEAAEYATDIMLLRYLRAREHVVDKAYKMFLESLAWRAGTKPWALENVSSRTVKSSTDARIVGYDSLKRVVVYSSFAHTTERTPEFVKLNTTAMMEKANACKVAGSPGTVIWVNHFGGHHKNAFSWRDCNPSFAWAALNIFSNHYPECLQTMVIIDPPSVFFKLWNIVRPMLPEKTQKKGQFVDSSKINLREFDELFGLELSIYIRQLIAQDAR